MPNLGQYLEAFGEGYTGKPSLRRRLDQQSLENLREENKFRLEQQKFQSGEQDAVQERIKRRFAVDRQGGVQEWNKAYGTSLQYDPTDDAVVDAASGNRFRLNEQGQIVPINSRATAAGNLLAGIRGSGAVKPGQDPALVEAFARAGGTPELRTEAQAVEKREREGRLTEAQIAASEAGKAPTAERSFAEEADRRGLAGAERYRFIQGERIRLFGGKAEAAATAQQQVKQQYKLNELLSPDEANSLGLPYGTTRIAAFGKFPLTATQRDQLSEFSAAETIIDDIADVSKRVNTFEAGPLGLGRAAGAAANTWGAFTQTNEDAALLDSKVGELSLLVRAMGEKGTLATKDVDRVAKLVPTKTDTRGVAIKKIESIRQFIESVKDKRLTAVLADISKSSVQSAKPKVLDADTAMQLLQQAGGDKDKARELARQQGYEF